MKLRNIVLGAALAVGGCASVTPVCGSLFNTYGCSVKLDDGRLVSFYEGEIIKTPLGIHQGNPDNCYAIFEHENKDWFVLSDFECNGTVDVYGGQTSGELVIKNREEGEKFQELDDLLNSVREEFRKEDKK